MKNTRWLILTLMTAGCSSDARVVRVAEQAAERQAKQNHEMARVTSEVAAASKELVEADAQARQEMARLHHDLGQEQRQIGHQRDQLEQERREIAQQRNRDPILAAAITDIGLVVAATLPLLLAALALWRLRDAGDELDMLNQILVEELVAEQPRLLPPPSSRDALPCLPASSESDVEPPF